MDSVSSLDCGLIQKPQKDVSILILITATG